MNTRQPTCESQSKTLTEAPLGHPRKSSKTAIHPGGGRTRNPRFRRLRRGDFAVPEETTKSHLRRCPTGTSDSRFDFACVPSFTAQSAEKAADLRNPQTRLRGLRYGHPRRRLRGRYASSRPIPGLPLCTMNGTLLRWHHPAMSTTDGGRFWRSCSSELRRATSRCESGYAGWCEKTERPSERT